MVERDVPEAIKPYADELAAAVLDLQFAALRKGFDMGVAAARSTGLEHILKQSESAVADLAPQQGRVWAVVVALVEASVSRERWRHIH